jgi:membrane protein implicated in regulation of membrane protease activity
VLFLTAVIAAILWVDSPWSWVLIGVAAVVEVGESFAWLAWSRRRRAKVGAEALIGKEAIVVMPCRPEGQVRLQGEIWSARCEEGADVDERVRVRSLDGITLIVTRVPMSSPSAGLDSQA